MRVEVASPREDFFFKTKPYDHQLQVFKTSRDREAYALFMDMGTGKSKVAIDTSAWLFSRGLINGLLIIAPKGVYGNWVNDQIPKHLADHILENAAVVQWKSNHTTQIFQEELKKIFEPNPLALHIFVINIEAINTKAGLDTCVRFLRSHDVMMIVDESTVIKHHTSKWTKRIIALGKGAKFRRILTGTPITNSPLDVYSQFEFLDPYILGHSSFFAFRNRYAVLRQRRVSQKSFTEIVGYQRLPELQEKMQKAAVIIRKEECLDLPPKIMSPPRHIEMSDRQRRMYDSMKQHSIAQLEGQGIVTVNMALTKILRLHQIACGFVTLDDETGSFDVEADFEGLFSEIPEMLIEKISGEQKTYRRVNEIDPDGGPRMKELLDLTEEVDGKIIIWANYTYNVQTVSRLLKKKYGHNTVGTYSGQTTTEDRRIIVNRFEDPNDPLRFFVGQTRTGGFGLTLVQAQTMIYFSNDYNLETRLQSEDRAHRIGQTRSVTYIDLVAPGTIDEKILQVLLNKQDLAEQVTKHGWRNLLS